MNGWQRYIGPSDSLGRVMIGDVITHGEFVNDPSKWVNTFVHKAIWLRLAWMVSR